MLLSLVFATAQLCAWDFWPLPMDQPDTEKDSLMYGVGISAIASSGTNAPLLMHILTNGDISKMPFSGNISASFYKPATRPHRWYDYDFAVALSGRFDTEKTTGYFNQLYAHARLYVFDFTVGITPLVCGSQDIDLSSGGLLFSGNSHPFPRITIGIDNYTAFPGLYGYLAVRGGITHAWLNDNYTPVRNTMLHHKFIGLKIGGKLPVNISYEFHHAAQWGGNSAKYGNLGSSINDLMNIFMGHSGGNSTNEQLNAEGNHIGFQEWCLWFNYKGWEAKVYWQNIFEDQPKFIGFGMNKTDGLWGLNIRQHHWKYISGFTYEFLNTTSQSGPWHDRDGLVYGGRDNYYNNSIYTQGWTYFGNIMGSPMLTTDNNRVRTHYIGLNGDIYGFRYRLIDAYTRSWGTWKDPAYFTNNAILLEVRKQVEQAWGLEFGLSLGCDIGTQFGNSFGAMISIRKQGFILDY